MNYSEFMVEKTFATKGDAPARKDGVHKANASVRTPSPADAVSGSLIDLMRKRIWHEAQDTEFDSGFNLAKSMAIALIRSHYEALPTVEDNALELQTHAEVKRYTIEYQKGVTANPYLDRFLVKDGANNEYFAECMNIIHAIRIAEVMGEAASYEVLSREEDRPKPCPAAANTSGYSVMEGVIGKPDEARNASSDAPPTPSASDQREILVVDERALLIEIRDAAFECYRFESMYQEDGMDYEAASCRFLEILKPYLRTTKPVIGTLNEFCSRV